jgi:hypothetical protein
MLGFPLFKGVRDLFRGRMTFYVLMVIGAVGFIVLSLMRRKDIEESQGAASVLFMSKSGFHQRDGIVTPSLHPWTETCLMIHDTTGHDRHRIRIYDQPYRSWRLVEPVVDFEAMAQSTTVEKILLRTRDWCEVKSPLLSADIRLGETRS